MFMVEGLGLVFVSGGLGFKPGFGFVACFGLRGLGLTV